MSGRECCEVIHIKDNGPYYKRGVGGTWRAVHYDERIGKHVTVAAVKYQDDIVYGREELFSQLARLGYIPGDDGWNMERWCK